jgi:peptidoglycan/LPS O-acetylase OafA/YrhL
MRKKQLFLRPIHYFRAFAIINIAFVHIWHIPASYMASHGIAYSIINILREVMFHDSTIYFIFISGFLFSYLSPKFEIKKYYKSKLYKVISPYVFMTILIFFLKYIENPPSNHTYGALMNELMKTLIYGKVQVHYWYIPFIIIVFAFSPLFLKIPALGSAKFIAVASILPLFGTRSGADITVWQYIYYFPIYLQGIYVALNYSKFSAMLGKLKIYILIIAITSSIFLIYFYIYPYQNAMIDIIESLHYIHKLSIGALVLLLFQKHEHTKYGLLDKFATYSYSIYFTHLLISNWVPVYRYFHLFDKSSYLIFIASIARTIIVIFLTLFVCILIKKILKKESRYLIGV